MIGVSAEGRLIVLNRNFTKSMERIRDHNRDSVQRNFGEGGRPTPWKDLARGGRSYLVQRGDMLRAIHGDSGEDWAETISGAFPFSRIHQLGGWAGRNHASFIPARKYMMLQELDIEFAKSEIADDIIFTNTNGISGKL